MTDMILLKEGEVVLKGLNKRYFEQKLTQNIRRRLKPLGKFRVNVMQSVIYVEPDDDGADVDAASLAGVRAALLTAVDSARGSVEAALAASDYTAAVKALAALRGPIDTFFDDVKVMADDRAEREQNLKLLNAFVDVFAQVADFGKMAKK